MTIQEEHRALRGRYRGQVLDFSTRRSIQFRNEAEIDQLESKDHVVVDYFFHEGEFWTAKIPLGSVSVLFGQAFNFSKPKMRAGADGPEKIYDERGVPRRTVRALNHLQTRFQLKSDAAIELFPLGNEPAGEPVHTVRDFVYSIEAVGPLGIGFGLRDGLNGSLVSAHRLFSTQEMVFERCVVESQYVLESPPLPVDDGVKQKLLRAALRRSHRAGVTETYYLYRCCGTNNCTSGPFQMLDSIAQYPWKHRLGALLYRLPLSPRMYLRVRGMDSDPDETRLVRDDFQDYIQDKATQQRKRDYVRAKTRALREARKQQASKKESE